ncbi:MAG TPA: NAD-dependent epimerase/dehydratase family protein [Actinomycetes bacterium]
MRLLVIGGTSFLGRSTVEEGLRRGHHVTTFNRGVSGADVPGVEAVRGDRSSDPDLEQLADRHFDAVVDTCGFVPRVVGQSAGLLAGVADRYVYVSSISAVASWPERPAFDGEDGRPCPSDAGPDDGDYGVLKAGCERAVTEVYGEHATVVRAGLILGPYENVGRLPTWLDRMSRGGEVLAPGDPDRPMQLVDARDLAAFMLDAGEQGIGGTFNATGPRGNATMGSWLGDCLRATGSDATLTWVPDDFLQAHDVQPWSELPLWSPVGTGADHVWDAETTAAEKAGLHTRPVTETVRDTWAWMLAGGRPPERPPHAHLPRHGIDPGKERRILDAWAERR